MALGVKGERLIKKYERDLSSPLSNPKPHLKAYRDSGGTLTIGWGHTGSDVYEGKVITESEAERLFRSDIAIAERGVNRNITIKLSQDQRDALISFTFNAGIGALSSSEIRRFVNKRAHKEATQVWVRERVTVDGRNSNGLVNRRREEKDLYLEGTNSNQLIQKQIDRIIGENKIDHNPNVIKIPYAGKTVSADELVNSEGFLGKGMDVNEFLNISAYGKTNHRRIADALSKNQRREYGGSEEYNPQADYPITNGAEIYITASEVKLDISYETNITIQNTILGQYWPNTIKEITNDPGYVQSIIHKQKHQIINPQLTVYIWSRALYLQQGKTGGFINVSRHIENVNMQSSLDVGGNFNLSMAPAIGELTVDGSKSTWEEVGDLGSVNLGNVNKTVERKDLGISESERNYLLYERIFQQNDLVFICNEDLEIEQKQSISDVIQGKWFDMIGLIDTVETFYDAMGNDAGLTIRGRDLIKGLQDDNTYFNPYSIGHVNSLFGGKLGDRYLQGEFKSLSAYLATTIREKVEFIAHQIASVGYVPDEVFDSFKDTTKFTQIIKDTESGVTEIEEKKVKGIWRLCKVFVDPKVEQLKLADDSIANPQGSIMELFEKLAQYPFVEFLSDTYRDKFYLIFRQPPFTQKALSTLLDSNNQTEANVEDDDKLMSSSSKEQNARKRFPKTIEVSEIDTISDNLHFSNEAYAWYQVEQRGNFAGNTVTLGHLPAIYFDEYAQVFGNRRMEIVNNYSDYKFYEHSEGEADKDIFAEQASQQLAFLIETSMYLPFTREGSITINADRRIKKGNWIHFRPTNEMFYVKGVNTTVGVSGQRMERQMTLEVERGMMKDYIEGKIESVNGKEQKVSYFNIVDLPKLEDGVYDTVTKGSADDKFDYKANIAINKDVFEFFLQRRQSNHER